MPFLDVNLQNAALDSLWGDHRGANAPASFEWGLLTGDPRNGGVELDFTVGGYARVTVPNDNTTWADADEGVKTALGVTFADSTGAWSDDATWEGIWVGGVLSDAAPLAEVISVSAAGTGPTITPSRYYNELV